MISDILEINDYIILIEQSQSEKPTIEQCFLDGNVIGFAFYGSGDVELEIKHKNKTKIIHNTTGIAISFFGNNHVAFSHKISHKTPLQSITVFIKLKNLHKLPKQEQLIYKEKLSDLINPKADFVEGPWFFMTPDMRKAVEKIHKTQYTGISRLMFLRSQIVELIAHFFAVLETNRDTDLRQDEKAKLFMAKEIMAENLSTPPTLNELSKQIGLNSNKLKKNFKELFGLPVFKYLHEERLNKAYDLLHSGNMNVQEVSWYVGYESVSSFSNAFQSKFNMRPSELRKKFLSNKS
jgi:AraC family transcriptional activator of pyochelin receptor